MREKLPARQDVFGGKKIGVKKSFVVFLLCKNLSPNANKYALGPFNLLPIENLHYEHEI